MKFKDYALAGFGGFGVCMGICYLTKGTIFCLLSWFMALSIACVSVAGMIQDM